MYLKWDEKIITDFSDNTINSMYNDGFLFARTEHGAMYQTRSLRIDLSDFELSSENRRVLKKTEALELAAHPLPYGEYDWTIGKMGKNFYEKKFGEGTLAPYRRTASGSVFSANKIKELLTNTDKSNFNLLLTYSLDGEIVGYAICRATDEFLHYCYPFYDLEKSPRDMGLGMMTRAVQWAKEQKKKYVYLGSATRPTDTYKLQFSGVEWFDSKNWNADTKILKSIICPQKEKV